MEKLTTREKQVLKEIMRGTPQKVIAGDLGMSIKTVSGHFVNVRKKLNIYSMPQLTKYAVSAGLVDWEEI